MPLRGRETALSGPGAPPVGDLPLILLLICHWVHFHIHLKEDWTTTQVLVVKSLQSIFAVLLRFEFDDTAPFRPLCVLVAKNVHSDYLSGLSTEILHLVP
jgi:hypothetical protein